MGDNDFDLLHIGHYRGMTTDVATGLSRATLRLTNDRSRLVPHGPGRRPAVRLAAIMTSATRHYSLLGFPR
jgi:hypothetical protein